MARHDARSGIDLVQHHYVVGSMTDCCPPGMCAAVGRELDAAYRPCQNRAAKQETTLKTPKTLTDGQRAYEAKRAAKAGMSLEKWLSSKQRQQEAETRAKEKVTEAAKPAKKPGLLSRLLERAQRPL